MHSLHSLLSGFMLQMTPQLGAAKMVFVIFQKKKKKIARNFEPSHIAAESRRRVRVKRRSMSDDGLSPAPTPFIGSEIFTSQKLPYFHRVLSNKRELEVH